MKANRKRILLVLAILTMALVLSCAFVACTKAETQDAPKKEFTITFDTQGGSEVKPITIAEGATITLPRNPTKEGYIFDGWYLSDEFIEKFNATQTISSNITVYAKWRLPLEDEVFVSFNTNGGDAIQGYYAIVGTKINLPVAPSRIGFDFDSWQYGDDKYPAGATFVVPNKNVEMVAIWNSQNLRYVTYDTNGGTEIEKSAVESGSKLTAPKQPKRPGYLFAGWYKDVNCTEFWDFDKDKVVDNLTLYAKWNVDAVGISSVEGATIDGTNIFMVIDQDVEFVELAEKVILSGNAYWNLYYDRLGQTKIPTKIAANRETGKLNKKDNTFYILVSSADGLQEKLYTLTIYRRITINVNYYDVYNTLIHTYKMDNYNTILQEYDYEPVGYTLNGWEYVDTNNRRTDFKFDKNGTVVTNETALDLYPKVTANSYTVTLTVGNGETVSKNKVIATYNSSVQFPVPEKTGYSFVGWYNGSTKVSTETGICAKWTYLEDISLSPKWQINSYNVSLAKNVNGGDLTGGGVYQFGSNVTITATTNKAYIWIGWFEGDTKLTSEKSYSFKITAENRNFTAKWDIEDEYKLFIINSTPNEISIVGVKDKNIKNIVIPNSVTSIGSSAFRGCTGLTSITIPDSVTSIGSSAFSGCSSLESITIPFVGAKAGVTSSDTYQYPFGYIFGTSSYTGGVATTQYYHGSSTSSTTSTTYYIPSSLRSVTVTGGNILYCAFCNCTGLTSITIPDSVTTIGWYAFNGCTGLTSVTIPNSVTSIGEGAFHNCTGLTSVTIPDGVKGIGERAFYGCTRLTSVTIPDSVTNIGNYAFYNCSGLTSITIPDSVTSIGNGAFYNCTGLTSITIPDSVTSISSYAFSGCSGLASITIPDSVTSIGDCAFEGCSGLTSVTIPDSVTSIGSYAFYNCTGLTSVTIPDSVTSIGNYAFSGCSGLTSITIPDSVTNIGSYAFYNCTGLTSVTIPNSVTSIGNYAFRGCTGLSMVNWNATECTSAGSSDYPIFTGCTNLTMVNIGENVITIPAYAFSGCSGLPSVTIPDSVTSIGASAFSGCSSLESITIPFVGAKAGVTSSDTYQYPFGYIFGTSSYTGGVATTQYYHGSSTFSTTSTTYYIPSSLKSVTVAGGNIHRGAFQGCSGLTSITIPGSVTSIGSSAFSGCSGLPSVTIPDSVTSIGASAFSGCSSLESITIPFVGAKAGVTSSDTYQHPFGYIFGTSSYTGGVATDQYYYSSSTSSTTDSTYYIPSSLKSVTVTGGNILYGAFYNCTGLTSVTIPNSVTNIGNYAFYNCSGLTSITIPDSVTTIGSYAFNGCTSLTTITIPNSVTSIFRYAFQRCSGLASVTIPDSVTSIGNGAFYNCTGLTSVAIGNSVTSIGRSAFSYCTGLTSVTIPDSVTSIGDYAFSGCTGLTSIIFKDTSSWYRTINYDNWINKSGGTLTGVTSATTNATYFKTTYKDCHWYKL